MEKDIFKKNSNKSNNPVQKWAKDLKRHFSTKIYEWPTGTQKGAKHH